MLDERRCGRCFVPPDARVPDPDPADWIGGVLPVNSRTAAIPLPRIRFAFLPATTTVFFGALIEEHTIIALTQALAAIAVDVGADEVILDDVVRCVVEEVDAGRVV